MAESQYGNLVKTLKYIQGSGGANAREMTYMDEKSLEGFNLNFIIGVYEELGDWSPFEEARGKAHAHGFDECLFFFGYDPDDLSYLGSELELSLGKEMEEHIIRVPTVVNAPRGVPHLPLYTTKVHKPFGHFHIALSGDYMKQTSKRPLSKKGETDGNKYQHLIHELPVKDGPGGAGATQEWLVSGENELGDFDLNVSMGIHNKPGEFYPGKGVRMHPYDSCLVFYGHKTDDLTYLGAEITIELGKEHEAYTFDKPTCIVLPKGTPYSPITCNKVDKSYRVVQIGLAKKNEVEWLD